MILFYKNKNIAPLKNLAWQKSEKNYYFKGNGCLYWLNIFIN